MAVGVTFHYCGCFSSSVLGMEPQNSQRIFHMGQIKYGMAPETFETYTAGYTVVVLHV